MNRHAETCPPSRRYEKVREKEREVYTIIRTSPADRQGGPWSRYGAYLDVYVLLYLQGGVPKLAVAE